MRKFGRSLTRLMGALALCWSSEAIAQSCAPGETAQSYAFTGAQQTVTVPAGVSSATVYLSGAQGASGISSGANIGGSGGMGALVSGTLAVTPGEVLTIGVGGSGSTAINPGGLGGLTQNNATRGATGGGATDILRGVTRLAIAGGGGGGGNAGWGGSAPVAGGEGGDSGSAGAAGVTATGGGQPGPFGGSGGTPVAGGAGGAGCGSFPATAGQAGGTGGASFNFAGSFAGAGAGGGGGGGAVVGGGGGGAGVGTTGCLQNWNGGGGGGSGGSSDAGSLQAAAISQGTVTGNGSALVCFAAALVINDVPADIVVQAASGQSSAAVSWTPPTTSGGAPPVALNSTHAPGSQFPIGPTTVTYTATDANNLSVTASFTVTVTEQPLGSVTIQYVSPTESTLSVSSSEPGLNFALTSAGSTVSRQVAITAGTYGFSYAVPANVDVASAQCSAGGTIDTQSSTGSLTVVSGGQSSVRSRPRFRAKLPWG